MSEIIAGVLGGLIGFLGSFLMIRFNYRQLFAQTVSENRMDWINHFREEFSIVVGTAKHIKAISAVSKEGKCCVCHKEDVENMVLEAERARAKLLTRLNLNTEKAGNEFNEAFEKRLKNIDFQRGCEEEELNVLIKISREILEYEWKRVKKEAKGEENNV